MEEIPGTVFVAVWVMGVGSGDVGKMYPLQLLPSPR